MSHDVDDLIALARRGLLSEPESRRLGMALQTSESARALHEVGLSFDASATARPGDDELLARVARRVASRRSTPSAPVGTPRRQRFIFMALALLVAGAAAASVASLVLDRGPRAGDSNAAASLPVDGARTGDTSIPTPSVQPPVATLEGRAGIEQPTSVEPAQVDPTNPTGAAPGVSPSEPTRATSQRPEPTAAQTPTASAPGTQATSGARAPSETSSAAMLFQTANAARKAGNATSALDGYRQLQRAFPASPEARVSHVLAGRLLLGAGQAGGALTQFDGYLRGGGQGGLAEEALWGKAQALARLGRTSEERAVWQTLLQQFPKSVYSATARQRLER